MLEQLRAMAAETMAAYNNKVPVLTGLSSLCALHFKSFFFLIRVQSAYEHPMSRPMEDTGIFASIRASRRIVGPIFKKKTFATNLAQTMREKYCHLKSLDRTRAARTRSYQ